ncbi:STP1 protein [Plasmodium ovale wallikeri]|uniref:STP1 protein n=1 Tax=Plasmodium ovale wallikeri TaxID=864142 RepID=A0A1A9AQ07_PLAOA|nr:STP1 protein [Plasmodium ovale wallikeri]
MADGVEYTTLTRYIDVEVFLNGIEGYIRSLIRKYGHKNCGLMHVELCVEIKNFITETKKLILKPMDGDGRKKWNREWGSKKNEFFNKLFQDEGFTYMCDSRKNTNNPRLSQLKSKHIDFCKERDAWKATVKKKNEFDECVKYNQWIEAQKKSFHQEYLNNVREFRAPTVEKYFITKDHPGGHDPRGTYQNSKLNCTQYNPPPNHDSQRPKAKEPPKRINPPTAPDVTQPSKEKNGKSLSDVDRESAKTKPGENTLLKEKPSTASSTIPSLIKIEPNDPVNGEQSNANAKDSVPPIKGDGKKNESTSIQSEPPTNDPPTTQDEAPPQTGSPLPPQNDARLAPAIQSTPAANATTSLSSSHSTVHDTTSNKTPVTSANAHSSKTLPEPSSAVPSLAQPQPSAADTPPAITVSQEPGTPTSSSVSTFTTPVTTTTMSPDADTNPTMSTAQAPIPSTEQVPSVSDSQKSPLPSASGEPKATVPVTVTQAHTSLSESDTGRVSVPTQAVTIDSNQQTTLSSASSPKTKESMEQPGVQLSNIVTQPSGQKPDNGVEATKVKLQKTIDQNDPKHNTFSVQIRTNSNHNSLTTHVNADKGTIPDVRPGADLNNNSFTNKGKNDNPNIILGGITPLKHIIPTIIIILAAITLLFLLYKYTPFGFFLGRRRKRKKRNLRRTFVIPEKPTYESPNITMHEWEDPNLVGQTVKNEEYIKLLKINRYKQEMQKRKKKNNTTLIEVHMEVLEEYKNDEWELHKGDFLEICLRGFINEENDFYSNTPNSKLILNNIKNEKTIEDIQKKDILWNNWIENHRNILEQWKKEEWFQILKNKWRKEQQIYKEKNNKLQENILNEEEKHSIVIQKDMWKQWISKQGALIDMFNKEDWFKSIIYAQDKEKDLYHINEYNDISVTSKTELKNEKSNHEYCRSKDIIQKLMVQIHMMVLEESIKEDIIKHKEACIDNFIEDIHTQNNYDEKRNMPQSDIDNFKVPEFEEIHTSINK